jgi:hypothetical protein
MITPDQFGGDIQQCINYALANNEPTVYIPKGDYTVNKLDIKRAGQAVLNLTGEPVAYTGQPCTTVLRFTNSSGYGLGLHEGKGVNISNLQLVNTSSVKTNSRYSPHAGIAIDPTTQNGSTDCKFENVYIDGFEVGVAAGCSGAAQNTDSLVFDRMWIGNAKVAMAFGHLQCRSNQVTNLKCWYNVHTVFDTVNYGQGTGDLPRVQGGNFVKVYQLFQTNNQYATGSFRDVYAESLYRIGDAFNSGWLPIVFDNCHLDMDINRGFPENILTGNNIQFRGGLIRYYDDKDEWKPMNVNCGTHNSGRVSFDGTWLNNPCSFGNGSDWDENISYNNVRFLNGKTYQTPVFTQKFGEYYGVTKGLQTGFFDMENWVTSAYTYYAPGQPVISRSGVIGVVDRIVGKRVHLKNIVNVPVGMQVGYQKPREIGSNT